MSAPRPEPGLRPAEPFPGPAAGPAAPPEPTEPAAGPAEQVMLQLFMVGAAVATCLGVAARVHTPTGVAVNLAGFSGPQEAKAWLASLAAALAVVQLVTAAAIYGRLPLPGSAAAQARAHRWSGRLAFLAAVPVALHCLYALGLQTYDLRVTVHSLLGCAFFGAFTTKMLALPRRGLPGWALPLLGGLVLTALVGVWLTSSLWFFLTVGVRW